MLFDTHAHLDGEEFDESREEIIAKFKESGVSLMLNAGASLEGSINGAELAKKYGFIYASVGIHPEYAGNVPEDYLKTLKKLATENEKVVAIGEIGLDYHYEPYDAAAQKKLFKEQCELARELKLPIIVHSRDAYADTLEIIKQFPDLKKVIHCFSGNLENAKELVALGCYISFTGVITFKNAKKFVDILRFMPKDRLFFETDCPYLAPEPVRGTVNDPNNVRYIVRHAAETIGEDYESLAVRTTENAKEFFGIK